MPDVATRPATTDDLAFIVSLVPSFASFGLPPWRDADAFLAACETSLRDALDAGATILIAEDAGGTPLGFIHLHAVPDLTGRPRGHVGAVRASRFGHRDCPWGRDGSCRGTVPATEPSRFVHRATLTQLW